MKSSFGIILSGRLLSTCVSVFVCHFKGSPTICGSLHPPPTALHTKAERKHISRVLGNYEPA